MEHFLLLGIIGVALVLFITEVIRADLVAWGVLLSLFFCGLISPAEAFSGFSNPAVITVLAMFILSAGLVNTGVADFLAKSILRLCGDNPLLLTAASMITVGIFSAFMNNIGAVAVLMPAMFAIAQKTGYPVSRLLMPLSFGSLLGGLITVIGTPPNLLISTALEESGFRPFALFDFAPTGLILLAAGVLYMLFIGRFLIPVREAGDLSEQFHLEEYLTEIVIPAGSPLVGKNLRDSGLREKLGLSILQMRRERQGKMVHYVPGPESILQAGDRMIAQGNLAPLLKEADGGLVEIFSDKKLKLEELSEEGVELAEVVIAPNSKLVGRTIREFDARRSLNVLVLALRRRGRSLGLDFAAQALQAGDVLLVQGRREIFAEMSQSRDYLVVSKVKTATRALRKAPVALAILLLSIGAAAFGWVHISIAAMAGAFLMAVTRCLKLEDMYTSVDWRVIFLIAGMIPLGVAMDDNHTGTARWIAESLLGWSGDATPLLILAGLFLFTTVLTEIMSNAAAAVLLAPLTIAIATGLGLEPYPFLMAVAIGASTTFLTPIGHQSNVLIYGVGNYRFTDFARVGLGLNILVFVLVLIIVPWIWPFTPITAQP
jgi:di/tricarboxylate transporter